MLTPHAVLGKLGALLLQVPGMSGLGKDAINTGASFLGSLKGTGNEASARTAAAGRFGALQKEGQASLAELDTRRGVATAGVPALAPVTNNVTQTATVNQTFNNAGDADPSKVRGAAKQGVVQGLNLRAAHAAGVQRGG